MNQKDYSGKLKLKKEHETKNVKKDLKKICVLGFFAISILGTLMHFVYDIFPNNVVAAIAPVNESTFEHLKLVLFPSIIYMIYSKITFGRKKGETLGYFIGTIVAMLVILTIHYGYKLFISENIPFLDIGSYYIGILAEMIIVYYFTRNGNENDLSIKVIYVLFAIMFMYFTFCPPKLEIFRDPLKNTYGIEEGEK